MTRAIRECSGGTEGLARLRTAAGDSAVREQEPMSLHTTFQVGGPADFFIEPESPAALAEMLDICREEGIPFVVLGRGSNVLVGDGGYRGVIFHIGDALSRIRREGCEIVAEAGITLSALARFARQEGLSGLEFAGGIPGSLGGALFMNAGAYGGEMRDVVREVLILTEIGEARWMPAEELALGYRTSRLQTEGLIALAARMELVPGDSEEIQERMADFAKRRRSKQPLEYPSAGSTFKRPPGYFAGKLIEDAGLAGYAVGGACVSEKHCGFVINRDHATAAEILQVCRDVAAEVERQTGVVLELEVRCLGEF
ncbi:MAG: UDP-N-acetylmuramate dehydrogenase [Lachnospiraceae bacterium]|nr:UDP-N-acetylmuramate dehydrogenase [Lachnospiraceae bacterium]